MRRRQHSQTPSRVPQTMRRGLVLIVVMVVVVMISLAGFGFVASMSNENKSVHLRGEQLQMESAIASAEEFLKQYLQRRQPSDMDLSPNSTTNSSPNLEENPEELMRGIVVDDDGPHSRVRFTVMAARYDDTGLEPWHYGLERESSRLDLQTLMDWERQLPGAGHIALMGLPGMTDAIADAMLDWMDADNAPRPTGAEQDYYASLNPPYYPRNGIPDSLEELLLIKGVNRSLLFGYDANQNHRLDLDEQSAMLSSASRDTSIGERQVPWIELLTLYSGERNQTRDGQPRIHLNQSFLPMLHQELTLAFDAPFATYVVLYRQYGASFASGKPADLASIKPDFSIPPRFFIQSLLDLVQSSVQVISPGGSIFFASSPLQADGDKSGDLLANLYDRVSVTDQPVARGLVNVNSAPAEVLRTVPGIDKALADQIANARSGTSKNDDRREKHPCWLLTEGLVSLEKMKQILPYLTAGGDVYRTQIIAFSEASRLSQRVEVVLDATRSSTRRVFWKDLQVLGRGYPWDVLDTPGGVTTSDSGAFDATSAGY